MDSDEENKDKQQMMEKEKKQQSATEWVAMQPFRDLYPHSDIVKTMKEFGEQVVPLSLVGHMMNYAGNHLLQYIASTYKKRIFYPLHKVVSIQLLSNGEILTVTKKSECVIKKSNQGHTVFQDQETTITFRSKAIVVSNGGVQNVHPMFYKWFPAMTFRKECVITGDTFLRKDLFKPFMNGIKE